MLNCVMVFFFLYQCIVVKQHIKEHLKYLMKICVNPKVTRSFSNLWGYS